MRNDDVRERLKVENITERCMTTRLKQIAKVANWQQIFSKFSKVSRCNYPNHSMKLFRDGQTGFWKHLITSGRRPFSRVNKHPRLDKIPAKGFSPEMSSFVPFVSTVEIPINLTTVKVRFSDKSRMAAIRHRHSAFVVLIYRRDTVN